MAALQADRKTNPRDVIDALKTGQEVELAWDGPFDGLVEKLQYLVGLKLTAQPIDNGCQISVSRDYQPSDMYHSPRPKGLLMITFENQPTIQIQTSTGEKLGQYIATASVCLPDKRRIFAIANSDEELDRQYEIISFDPIAAELAVRHRRM